MTYFQIIWTQIDPCGHPRPTPLVSDCMFPDRVTFLLLKCEHQRPRSLDSNLASRLKITVHEILSNAPVKSMNSPSKYFLEDLWTLSWSSSRASTYVPGPLHERSRHMGLHDLEKSFGLSGLLSKVMTFADFHCTGNFFSCIHLRNMVRINSGAALKISLFM